MLLLLYDSYQSLDLKAFNAGLLCFVNAFFVSMMMYSSNLCHSVVTRQWECSAVALLGGVYDDVHLI